jgi:maltooligosyltrehalose trehalohydrolase
VSAGLDGQGAPLSWGAQVLEGGGVRFRLWAPGLEALTLRVNGTDRTMSRAADGWFEHVAEDVAPDAEYLFVLPDGMTVPDPASRAQVRDVHGPSIVVDPRRPQMDCPGLAGPPLGRGGHLRTPCRHVHRRRHLRGRHRQGSIISRRSASPRSRSCRSRSSPAIADGGYDGVLPYAPHRAYGGPEGFKAFIDAAHARGLMVLLDVVYNHFGPDGNYISLYAPGFFHPEDHTPWGAAIAFDADPVRRFFVENALYWLDEYRLDGLRLDAVDHVADDLLIEIGQRVRAQFPMRHVHLTTEDNRNVTVLHERGEDGAVTGYSAEWNDDFHSVAHVFATGETDGYFADFKDDPVALLARALAEGFAYQGRGLTAMGPPPRRAERASAADGLRRLPAKPRPGGQSRLRGAPARPRLARHAARADCGPAAFATHSAAVHG